MRNLTLAYWVLNECRYLPEYLEFHLLQGVDYFILYDNGSTDHSSEVLQPYIDAGLVEVRTYPPGITRKNFWAMVDCIQTEANKTKWLHFHAIDERIFSPTGKKLPEVLEEFDQPHIAGVCVNWVQLHSSGVIDRPVGTIIENFFKSQSVDPQHHIKTIIRPDRTRPVTPNNPHNFFYPDNMWSVEESGSRVDGPFNPHPYTFNKLKNLHYATLSLEEFEIKANKGVLDHGGEHMRRPTADAEWSYYHDNGSVDCHDMIPFINPVKAAISERFKHRTDLLQYINH